MIIAELSALQWPEHYTSSFLKIIT